MSPDAEKDFHLHYGAALAAWTQIESNLGHLFEMTIGGSVVVANQVFFSARSFPGRVEMLQAAIRAASKLANANKEGFETFRVIAKKSAEWSKFRNGLAHDMPVFDMRPGSSSAGQYVIMSGSGKWKTSHPDSDIWYKNRITLDHMKIMRSNFAKLANLIMSAWNESSWLLSEELHKLREQVLLLPRDAHSTEPMPKGEASRRRP